MLTVFHMIRRDESCSFGVSFSIALLTDAIEGMLSAMALVMA